MNDDARDGELRRAFGRLDSIRGPCPDPVELLSCLGNSQLPAALEEHVAICASCSLTLAKVEELRMAAGSGFAWAKAAVAAAILILLVPASLYFVSKPVPVEAPAPTPPREARPAILEARVIDAAVARRLEPRMVTGTAAVFVLSVFVQMKEGSQYGVIVLREGGAEVARLDRVEGQRQTGTIEIACNRKDFLPGRYVLRVVERLANGGDGEVTDFPVEVR